MFLQKVAITDTEAEVSYPCMIPKNVGIQILSHKEFKMEIPGYWCPWQLEVHAFASPMCTFNWNPRMSAYIFKITLVLLCVQKQKKQDTKIS